MDNKKKIFALGFFDGVHLGHRALLGECCRLAEKTGAKPCAITFDRHPQSLFVPEAPLHISTVWDRQWLLRKYGIGLIYTYPVTKETMSMSWEAFLEELISYDAAGFVCGSDFRFGRGGAGNAEKLEEYCRQRQLKCTVVPEQTLDGIRVSSTHIRELLETGRLEEANRFLGHPHVLSGTVISGRRIGRTIGVPTANLALPEGVICPKLGVYACLAEVEGRQYPAVTNIGTRPTVGGHHVMVEPWLLDFEGDLYGKSLRLEFYAFLREERKFESLDRLKEAIRENELQTRALFR